MNEYVILTRPEASLFWTAPVGNASEMNTEDPLGLDYIAQQLGNLLLPTLTTRSNRAQAYAMVLYGLDLVRRAVERFGYPNTDEVKRDLFERWEKLWALATLEYRKGDLPRGDWDGMRGVRGARRAWKASGERLSFDFTLISRQQELGNLGAYLAPLRKSGLIPDGSITPSPAANDIIDNFWDEREVNRDAKIYDEFALAMLAPKLSGFERRYGKLTLATVGERSRLTSLVRRRRSAQQGRLYRDLFERARDPNTLAVMNLVQLAASSAVKAPRDILTGAIEGRFGVVTAQLHDQLMTVRAYGDLTAELLATFDRVYAAVRDGGWVVPTAKGEQAIARHLDALKTLTDTLLSSAAVLEIRKLPMHGASFLRFVDSLRSADVATSLGLMLEYHARVQRDRRRGGGWIRNEGEKMILQVTSYSARPDNPRFPAFKLDVVRTLLTDLGQLPFDDDDAMPEVGT